MAIAISVVIMALRSYYNSYKIASFTSCKRIIASSNSYIARNNQPGVFLFILVLYPECMLINMVINSCALLFIDLGLHFITVQKVELKEWKWPQHYLVG